MHPSVMPRPQCLSTICCSSRRAALLSGRSACMMSQGGSLIQTSYVFNVRIKFTYRPILYMCIMCVYICIIEIIIILCLTQYSLGMVDLQEPLETSICLRRLPQVGNHLTLAHGRKATSSTPGPEKKSPSYGTCTSTSAAHIVEAEAVQLPVSPHRIPHVQVAWPGHARALPAAPSLR